MHGACTSGLLPRLPRRRRSGRSCQVVTWVPKRKLPYASGANLTHSEVCKIAFGPHYGVCAVRSMTEGDRQTIVAGATQVHLRTALCAVVVQGSHTVSFYTQTASTHPSRRRIEPCETKPYFPAMDGKYGIRCETRSVLIRHDVRLRALVSARQLCTESLRLLGLLTFRLCPRT